MYAITFQAHRLSIFGCHLQVLGTQVLGILPL